MIELQKSNAQITFTTPTVSGGGYVDLSDYYTKDEVNNLIENVEVDLTGYATEDYVKQEIAAIPEVDLSGYATETYVNDAIAAIPEVDLSDYAKKTDIPDTTGLATEDYVDNAVSAIEIPEVIKHISITDVNQLLDLETGYYYIDDGFLFNGNNLFGNLLVNKEVNLYSFIDSAYTQLEYTEEDGWMSYTFVYDSEYLETVNRIDTIESAGFQTKEQVDTAISEAIAAIPEVDLSNYYTKAQVDDNCNALASGITSNTAKITTIEKAGYQTAEQVQTAINNALGVIENGTY